VREMTPEFVTGFFIEAIKTGIMVAAPCLVFGLVAGVLVSMFQAATQINEMTLVFIPKMLAVGLAVLIFFPWMLETIIEFTQRVFENLGQAF
jgi:flagellar biosynthesis protein FliQ